MLFCFCWVWMSTATAQNNTDKKADSLKVLQLHQQLETAIAQKQYTQAINLGKQALQLTNQHLFVQSKVKVLLSLGKLYTQTNKTSEALSYYLQAESFCQNYNNLTQLVKVHDQMGLFFMKYKLYKKALQYFRKSYQSRNKNRFPDNIVNVESIAFCHYILKDYNRAQLFYEKLLAMHRKQRNQQQVIQTLEQLALVASIGESYAPAIKYNLTLLKFYKKSGNIPKVSGIYNDLGFLYKRRNDLPTALSYFSLSSELLKKKKLTVPEKEKITLLVNTGVAYTNQESFNRARKYFQQAAQIAPDNSVKQAEIHNYAGSNYYLSGNNFQALKQVEQAIAIAQPRRAWGVLLTSYDLLARIYAQEGNNKKVREYKQKYRALYRQIQDEQKKTEQQASYNQALMNQQERRIKNLLAEQLQLQQLKDKQEKQQKDLALKNNLLKLQQQQLALYKKEKELDVANFQRAQLDKVRQQQALLISQGKLREAKLAQDKTLATLELERKNTEQKIKEAQNRQKLAKLESEKKIQQQKIEQQKLQERYAVGAIVLIGIILVLVTLGLINTRRNKRKLQKQNIKIEEQNGEIISQNEELHQQQEEIMAHQDAIEEKNSQLNRQNVKIHQSIKAAMNIQTSIAPDVAKMTHLLGEEHFILYRPKDIVSGDFYWLEKIQNRVYLAVVDCTGHGVPGAFMSLIGNNLLKQIVQLQRIKSPAEILNRLNREVEIVLKQKENGYQNGMDLALITWENKSNPVEITFSAAKRPFYYVSQGTDCLQKLKGDRYSIGFPNPEFTDQVIHLQKGDYIYLCTDGFVDQHNFKRKKIGSKNFEQLLFESHTLPLAEQKKSLETQLETHQGKMEQRDDILVVGLKL